MAWNFLQIVEHGASSGDLYPIPTGQGVGFKLLAQDTNPKTFRIIGLKVARQTFDDRWIPSLNVLRTNGTLLISDHRIAVTFDKFVPKDQSSFQPVPFVRPDGSTTKRPKQMLVGQLLMTQVGRIGVQNTATERGGRAPSKANRDDGFGTLIVSTTDDTSALDGPGDVVAIEIILATEIDCAAIGNDVMSRSAFAKLRSPQLSIDQAVRQEWSEVIHRGFSQASHELQHLDLSPYRSVTIPRPTTEPPNPAQPDLLTPPTDTSPVPTMWPTPAVASPRIEAEQIEGQQIESEPEARPLPEPLVPAPPPPGTTPEWRPDPFGRFDLRYWDRFGWTEHVIKNGQQHTDDPG